MTTIANAMKESQHKAFKLAAIVLSLIVYSAGLLYAGVRSYSLFSVTIEAWLLPLAVVGIVALELTAIALPLAIHFWTQPGAQRMAAMGFYLLDLALIAVNAVLDAARHGSAGNADVIWLLDVYGVYVMPAVPLFCMAGWSLIWLLDPSTRERDMRENVKAATHEALLSRIQEAVAQADITQAVDDAANEAARALVGETLGSAPRRAQTAPPASPSSGYAPPASLGAAPPASLGAAPPTQSATAERDGLPELRERAAAQTHASRNGSRADAVTADPKG